MLLTEKVLQLPYGMVRFTAVISMVAGSGEQFFENLLHGVSPDFSVLFAIPPWDSKQSRRLMAIAGLEGV